MDDAMLAAMANQAQAESRTPVPEKTETKTEDITATDDEIVGDEQDFSRTPWDERTPEERGETEEPSKQTDETETDNTETETKTNTETSEETTESTETAEVQEEDPNEWLRGLPEPPKELELTAPEYDEEGNVTNMDGPGFIQYTVELAKHEARVENFNNAVLNRSLDVAEQILPDIKTNDDVRALFETQMLAETMRGGTAVDAARAIAKLRGDSVAEGRQSAKTRIEVVKNSTLESPVKSESQTDPKADKQLTTRLKANDSSAFDELFDDWMTKGKV